MATADGVHVDPSALMLATSLVECGVHETPEAGERRFATMPQDHAETAYTGEPRPRSSPIVAGRGHSVASEPAGEASHGGRFVAESPAEAASTPADARVEIARGLTAALARAVELAGTAPAAWAAVGELATTIRLLVGTSGDVVDAGSAGGTGRAVDAGSASGTGRAVDAGSSSAGTSHAGSAAGADVLELDAARRRPRVTP
jgi:hypothetical protein